MPFMLNEKNFFVDNLAIGAKYHKSTSKIVKMRQKVLLGSFKAIKFPLQSSPRISRAVCSKNSHISSVSRADPYVVHPRGYLVAIACRLSPWPTYRPHSCRMPLCPGQLPSLAAFHGPLSRFRGSLFCYPPCFMQGLHAVRAVCFAGRRRCYFLPWEVFRCSSLRAKTVCYF